jgi:hypothetical protein
MQRLPTTILLLVTLLGFTNVVGAADRWETLRAINWVENPTNHTAVGRHGELGPYQFRPGTWRMHTDKPFSLAAHKPVADEIAVKHYEWIKRTLERRGVEANVFNISMAWNCGVEAVLSGRAPVVSYNYAERVTNLVDTFKQRVRPVAVEAKLPPAPGAQWSVEGNSMGGLRFRVMQDAPKFVVVAG